MSRDRKNPNGAGTDARKRRNGRYEALIVLALRTGMRQGELAALRWGLTRPGAELAGCVAWTRERTERHRVGGHRRVGASVGSLRRAFFPARNGRLSRAGEGQGRLYRGQARFYVPDQRLQDREPGRS